MFTLSGCPACFVSFIVILRTVAMQFYDIMYKRNFIIFFLFFIFFLHTNYHPLLKHMLSNYQKKQSFNFILACLPPSLVLYTSVSLVLCIHSCLAIYHWWKCLSESPEIILPFVVISLETSFILQQLSDFRRFSTHLLQSPDTQNKDDKTNNLSNAQWLEYNLTRASLSVSVTS